MQVYKCYSCAINQARDDIHEKVKVLLIRYECDKSGNVTVEHLLPDISLENEVDSTFQRTHISIIITLIKQKYISSREIGGILKVSI